MCSCRGPSTCKQGRRLYKRCSCKQWPCTYTAPCVARTCWEESQTHIAAPPWQRRSTHPARALMHAANAPRRGRSCTDQQHRTPPQHRQQNAQHHPHTHDQTARRHPGHTQHTPTRLRSDTQPPTLEAVQHPQPRTIRPPDSTKARPTIKPDRLFLLHDGAGHRPAETIRSSPGGIHAQQHTVRPPPMLHAASTFRRGDHPQIRRRAHHQHDPNPMPTRTTPGSGPRWKPTAGPAGSSSHHAHDQTAHAPADRPAHAAPVLVMGKPPADTIQHAQQPHPDRPQIPPV